jgi:hypothetical protein
MHVLTDAECLVWLKNNCPPKIVSDTGDLQLYEGGLFSVRYSYPKDSGKKVALAKMILRKCFGDSKPLIWLRNWEIWPSSGHVPILLRIRQALNHLEPLEETPGHVFDSTEKDDAASLVILSLEFYWDCLIVAAERPVICLLSHDEYCAFISQKDEDLNAIREVFSSRKWGAPL